jgi:hypothetical protein
MPFEPGINSVLSVDATAIESFLDSISYPRRYGTVEVTAFGDAAEEHIATVQGGTISGSGHWDATNDATMDGLFDGATVAFEFGPEGGTTGDIKYSGNALVTDYSQDSDAKGKVSFSFALQITGAVTRGTYA